MKLYKIAQAASRWALAYRVCIMRSSPNNPQQAEVRPPYRVNPMETNWTAINVGQPLYGEHHVGTKIQFCMSYYTGCAEIADGETEVLLTLKVPKNKLPLPEDDSYMGSEAIVSNPIVVKIEPTDKVTY